MTILQIFDNAFRGFRDAVLDLSDEQFMSHVKDRTARDIVAHLIGWNDLMIEAAQSVMAGTLPAFYADAKNDYSHVNAGFMANYPSSSKHDLVAELESTKEKFTAFFSSLPAAELTTDHGVTHPKGGPVTITRLIDSLAGDYEYHTRELKDWFKK